MGLPGLGVAAFGLRLTGSWWMALPLLVCGTLAFLSGSFFPLSGAPTWLNVVSHLLPLRYLNDGMLDVMVRGDGPGAALLPIAILLAFATVVVLISTRFFTWETN